MKRPKNFEEHIGIICLALADVPFATYHAAEVLEARYKLNYTTAYVYASMALRYQMRVQGDCPEGIHLARHKSQDNGRRYVWEERP